MCELNIKQLNNLKKQAEHDILIVVSNIFEQFKLDTGITHADQSINIEMQSVGTLGHRYAESIISGVSISMEIFE